MKKKFINVIIIFTLVMFIMLDVVYASSLKVSMTQVSSAVGEYTITVKVSDLDVGDNGINALTATVDIPSGNFEDVTSANFTGLNNWTASYTADTKKITLFKSSFTKENEDIFTIKLKTKSSSTNVSGTIKLKDIIVSNGQDEINADEATVQIGSSPTNTNTSNNAATNQPNLNSTNNKTNNTVIKISNNVVRNNTNNSTSNNAINNASSDNVSVNNTSNYINRTYANNTAVNSTVPYTGVRENVRIVLIVLMLVCGYIYYRIQKMNKIC